MGLRRQVAEYQSGNRLPHSKSILLTVFGIYLPMPMLLAAPTDVVALNFFFDTLLFCGAITRKLQPIVQSRAGPRRRSW